MFLLLSGEHSPAWGDHFPPPQQQGSVASEFIYEAKVSALAGVGQEQVAFSVSDLASSAELEIHKWRQQQHTTFRVLLPN